MSFINITPAKLAGLAIGVIAGTLIMVASAAAAEPASTAGAKSTDTQSMLAEVKAAGVVVRLKPGTTVTADQVAARNKVDYDKLAPGMGGSIRLVRADLVPLSVANADAARLRADQDVDSAWADYVIQSRLVIGGQK